MDITQFLTDAANGPIAIATLTTIAADRRALGDDVVAAFGRQIEQRAAAAAAVLDAAETAGRETLQASEQRQYDAAIRERDSLLSLQAAVERRTAARAFVPETQAPAIHTRKGGDGTILGVELRELVSAGSKIAPPEQSGSFFDRLAAESVALQSGIHVIATDRETLKVPRVVADPTATWTSEGTEIGATDPDLDEVTATPRKLAARVIVSNELIADSNPSVVSLLEQQLVRALSLELDRAIFMGSGTPPEIRGLDNVVGTLSDGSFSLTSLDDFADAIAALEAENARATAIVMNPGTWGTLTKVKEATASNNKPLLQDSAGSGSQGVRRSIYGVPVFTSSQLASDGSPSTAETVYIYDAPQIVLVRRAEIRVEVDRSRLFHKDQAEIRAILRADLVVPNPTAVFIGSL